MKFRSAKSAYGALRANAVYRGLFFFALSFGGLIALTLVLLTAAAVILGRVIGLSAVF